MANRLFYGDNLHVLREQFADASVDLVYLDPPFNSNRSFNVLFAHRDSGEASEAQIEAFDDTWTWDYETEQAYHETINADATPAKVSEALTSMHSLLGPTDVLAYLVMMTARLVELRRVMRSTASIYLHCDPTASHYLKLIMDALFGPENFRNEICWQRSGAKNDSHRYGRSHDTILFYTKSKKFTWKTQYTDFQDASIVKNYTHVEEGTGRRYRRGDLTAAKPGGDVDFEWHGVRPYKGRHWAYSRENMDKMYAEGRIEFRRTGMPVYKRYLDEQPGVPLQDVWSDIRLTSADKERLGYPTQKPTPLLERILMSSSDVNDVVLDPFCGCGTTIAAAQTLGRSWAGIDITYLAIDLIDKRLRDTYGRDIAVTYDIRGIPRDMEGAQALAKSKPFDFERWAVSMVNGQPNDRQVGDRGVDGIIRFTQAAEKGAKAGRVAVSVKGGKQIGPSMVRDLAGSLDPHNAQMGVLITLAPPSKGMVAAANSAGTYTWPWNGTVFPKVQIITVEQLLGGARPNTPSLVFLPYIQAQAAPVDDTQLSLGF